MAETQNQLTRLTTEPDIPESGSPRRRVAVVTGTRAEFGLLLPVMRAIQQQPILTLLTLAGGAHLLKPAETVREVAKLFEISHVVPMQIEGCLGRVADARALGQGVIGFTDAFAQMQPDWIVVLGDRIEAFAAAIAANLGGWALAHIHGGDRAEGVADESMRHAITKLAHLHFPATDESGDRIVRMGERREAVYVVGSPAIDDLESFPALDEACMQSLGTPDVVLLMHPTGRSDDEEAAEALEVISALRKEPLMRVLAMEPNHDPGREGVMRALRESGLRVVPHLDRRTFVGLLRRVRVLVGNSSAGLIEAAAVGCPVVNVGRRQAGRFCPINTISVEQVTTPAVHRAILQADGMTGNHEFVHPYGDGSAGLRIAQLLATINPHAPALLRKRNSY